MQADGIWANIFRGGRRKESLAEVLGRIPLFNDLNPKELRILGRIVHIRTYQDGEIIFRESEPGAGMYVIRSGRVDIILNHGSEEPVILAQLEPGDFFGEMALLGDSARTATSVAHAPSELIGFFHPDLIETINMHPVMGAKISLGLARTLATRLRFTNDQLRSLGVIRGTLSHEDPLR